MLPNTIYSQSSVSNVKIGINIGGHAGGTVQSNNLAYREGIWFRVAALKPFSDNLTVNVRAGMDQYGSQFFLPVELGFSYFAGKKSNHVFNYHIGYSFAQDLTLNRLEYQDINGGFINTLSWQRLLSIGNTFKIGFELGIKHQFANIETSVNREEFGTLTMFCGLGILLK